MSISIENKSIMVSITGLSLVDGIFTWIEINNGLVTELNPFMIFLFSIFGLGAIVIKVLMTFVAVYFLIQVSEKTNEIKPGINLCDIILLITLIIYTALTIFHAYILRR